MTSLQTDPDPALLATVDASCFADAWDAATYARMRANGAVQAWLLEGADGTAVGLLCFQRAGDEAEVYRIAVVPEHRGRRLGAWLLARLLEWSQSEGVRQIVLEVRAGNAAARRLYERAGFHETGRRPGYYREPEEDAICYRRDASDAGGTTSSC